MGAFEILSLDLEKKRIGVALVQEDWARAGGDAEELRDYSERQDVASEEGFGSLADKFRGALESRKK
jgi:hypothetical protein